MISRTGMLALAIFMCGSTLWGQVQAPKKVYPTKQLRAGFVFTDLISNRFRMDLDYRVAGPHVVGVGLGLLYGSEDMDNRIGISERQPLKGYYTNLSYKYYYAANDGGRTFHFSRISASYQHANITYYGYSFIPFEEDGLTYYNYEEVDQHYIAQNIGLKGEIGFEIYFDPFFMELSFGMLYQRKVNEARLPSQFSSGGRPFDIDYTGVTPTIGYKLGVYLD